MPQRAGNESNSEDSTSQSASSGVEGEDGAAGDPAGQEGDGGQQGTGGQTGAGQQAGAEGVGGSDGDGTGAADGSEGADGAGGSGDDELDAALKDFDGKILSERATVAARANETAGERDVSDPGGGVGEDDADAEGTAGESAGKGRGSSRDNAAGAVPNMGDIDIPDAPPGPVATADGSNVDLPKDVADAKDDDVVARQLREAAMAESDPVLREKLWDEYRRYKAGR